MQEGALCALGAPPCVHPELADRHLRACDSRCLRSRTISASSCYARSCVHPFCSWDTRGVTSRLCAVGVLLLLLLRSRTAQLLGLQRWGLLLLGCVRMLRLVVMHLGCRLRDEACVGMLLPPWLCDLYAGGPQCRVACWRLSPASHPDGITQPTRAEQQPCQASQAVFGFGCAQQQSRQLNKPPMTPQQLLNSLERVPQILHSLYAAKRLVSHFDNHFPPTVFSPSLQYIIEHLRHRQSARQQLHSV